MSNANLPATSSTSRPISSTDTRVQRAVSDVFERLSAAVGRNKMAELYADVDKTLVRAEWAAGLAGFKPSEIERGLAACRTRKFAPNLGEFMHLCRPVLDPEIAWEEAVAGLRARESGEMGQWSHPAVYRAARRLAYDMRRLPLAAMRRRWEVALQDEFAKGWGEDIPQPAPRIEHQPAGAPAPAFVREYLVRSGLRSTNANTTRRAA